MDYDCNVDLDDLVIFTQCWLYDSSVSADIDRDLKVDFIDWAQMAAVWLEENGQIIMTGCDLY